MPITQTCPTCGGTGIQTLGMSFDEAITLAQEIGVMGNLFTVRSIEWVSIQNYGAWIVKAAHLPSAGTVLTFKRPEDYAGVDWARWNPLAHAER